jgi:hypothetical protein
MDPGHVVSPSDVSPFLHVANGTSTTMTIEAARIPGLRSIWADPLYEGPVPSGLSDEELLEVRRRYLAGPSGSLDVDPVIDLREWRHTIERHAAYDELVLWFEHDLFDQLNLIQLLSWIRHRLPESKVVSLICIGSFPGHPRFHGLGELAPDEIASLLGTRRPVSEAQYALAERAWQAFREPTPQALNELCRSMKGSDPVALPYLAPALVRFLQEYPWATDGLSRTERRLLQLADAGSIKLSAAFPRMHDDENAYYVTDLSLAALVESLSGLTPPLLTLVPAQGSGDEIFRSSVTITDAGRAVLRGEEDRVRLFGTDRWLGGVHLQGKANTWRWDDARQQVTVA